MDDLQFQLVIQVISASTLWESTLFYLPHNTLCLMACLNNCVREDLPSDIEILASLPKMRSGKLARRALKAETLGQDPGVLSTLAD